jgi:alpha-beta hydrolase superfamily lysophospholipase
MVAILHGLGEHGGRYAALASDLADAGLASCTVDLPGHGASPGGRGDASWPALRDEVAPALLDVARALPGAIGRVPVFLLGHSMGGLLALDVALSYPDAMTGLVVSGPAFVPGVPPPAWKVGLARVVGVVAPGARFNAGIQHEQRSRDAEVIDLARKDPLIHPWITPRLYFGLAEAGERVMGAAPQLAVPTVIVQGDADTVVSPSATRAFAAAAGGEQLTLNTYPNMRHEVFNEQGRGSPVQAVVSWMGALAALRETA